MRIPEQIPGLRLATVLVALYAVIWIALEGDLGRVLALALSLTLVLIAHLFQRLLAGRGLSPVRWLLTTSLGGVLGGWTCALLALLLMGLKPGLHGHGPEFPADQISWVVRQAPLWGATGLLAGLGLGLITSTRDH